MKSKTKSEIVFSLNFAFAIILAAIWWFYVQYDFNDHVHGITPEGIQQRFEQAGSYDDLLEFAKLGQTHIEALVAFISKERDIYRILFPLVIAVLTTNGFLAFKEYKNSQSGGRGLTN